MKHFGQGQDECSGHDYYLLIKEHAEMKQQLEQAYAGLHVCHVTTEGLQWQLKQAQRGSLSCSLCNLPVVFEFTVASETWNRLVRAKGIDEYLCFWCFDKIAAEHNQRVPVGVNINGLSAFSSWCGDDVPGTYGKSECELRLEHAEAALRSWTQVLINTKTFIEYARYELEDGKATIGDQFPKKVDADIQITQIVEALEGVKPE